MQYVEVRCLDIDPYAPVGIQAETGRFVDAFLLFCAASDSPYFPASGYCQRSADNFSTVVKEGRKPGLQLDREGQPVSLAQWGNELLDRIAPYAALYDSALGGDAYAARWPPSAPSSAIPMPRPRRAAARAGRRRRLVPRLLAGPEPQARRDAARAALPAATAAAYEQAARDSAAEQIRIEQADTEDFDTYVARYHAALKAPRK